MKFVLKNRRTGLFLRNSYGNKTGLPDEWTSDLNEAYVGDKFPARIANANGNMLIPVRVIRKVELRET